MNHENLVMPKATSKWRWVLASASPRRIELIKHILDEVEIRPANIEEVFEIGLTPSDQANKLAYLKAQAVSNSLGSQCDHTVVIGADTIVAIGSKMLAKPKDKLDAIEMLKSLSGKTHLVVTGVCLLTAYQTVSFAEETFVTFKNLSEIEIEQYVGSNEPMDKAGGYAIQGGAARFVDRIDGDVKNVIGLPVTRLAKAIQTLISSSPS